jgi:lysophospholipase L1-like esterase
MLPTFVQRALKALATLLPLILLNGSPLLAQQSGPSPYPDAKAEAAWPGKGPIRYFGWMTDNRKSFWSKREADRGKIIFTGDSIIGGWKLEKDFPGLPIVNRGIGGDVTRGMLFRLQEDILDLQPKAIVFHIGANDITAGSSAANVVANYNAILDQAQKANPETPILILAVLPHGIPTGDKAPKPDLEAYLKKVNALIPVVNQELAKISAARKNVTFVDSYTPFLLPDGNLDGSFFSADKVHPNEAGHTKLGTIVRKALADLKLL